MEVYSRAELLRYCSTETVTNFALEGFILSVLTLVAFWTIPSTFTQCSERLWLFLGNLYSWSKTQPHTTEWHEHGAGLTGEAPAATSDHSIDWLSHSSWGVKMPVVEPERSWRIMQTWATRPLRSSGSFFQVIHSNESRRWLTSTVVKFCFPLGSSPQPIICLHPSNPGNPLLHPQLHALFDRAHRFFECSSQNLGRYFAEANFFFSLQNDLTFFYGMEMELFSDSPIARSNPGASFHINCHGLWSLPYTLSLLPHQH